MSIVLYVVGSIIIFIHFIMSIKTGSFYGFVAVNATGFATALIFFALGKILSNQEDMSADIRIATNNKEPINPYQGELKKCKYCNKMHDPILSSCPYCGFRE